MTRLEVLASLTVALTACASPRPGVLPMEADVPRDERAYTEVAADVDGDDRGDASSDAADSALPDAASGEDIVVDTSTMDGEDVANPTDATGDFDAADVADTADDGGADDRIVTGAEDATDALDVAPAVDVVAVVDAPVVMDALDAANTMDAGGAADAADVADTTDAMDALDARVVADGTTPSDTAQCRTSADCDGGAACHEGVCRAITCAAGQEPRDGRCVVTSAPRPLRPLTGDSTGPRPTFRWVADGADGARVEVCRDRACTVVVRTEDVFGTRYTPDANLPVGRFYWRARARTGTFVGPAASAALPFKVGPIGDGYDMRRDVNGDGRPDLVLATPGAGTITVHFGGSAGVPVTASQTFRVPTRPAGMWLASFAGDVNGDGYADVLFGDHVTAHAELHLGGPTGVSATASATVEMVRPTSSDFFVMSSAGDFNGDGFDDVVLGPFDVAGMPGAYDHAVYGGTPTGLTSAPITRLRPDVYVSRSLDRSLALGDVNSDGFDDVLVTQNHVRLLNVFYGRASGAIATPAMSFNAMLFTTAFSRIDMNMDGYTDLFAGGGATNWAAGYVYLGGPSGIVIAPRITLPTPNDQGFASSCVGDVNQDGRHDVVAHVGTRSELYLGTGVGFNPTPIVVTSSVDGSSTQPPTRLGDINGDGFDDFTLDPGGARVLVIPGSATGVSTNRVTFMSYSFAAPGP